MKDELTKIAAAMREYAAKVEAMAVEPEKPQTPKPPPGYRLATEAERQCLPEGAKVYSNSWQESGNIGSIGVNFFDYAVPDTFEAHGKIWTRHTPGDPRPETNGKPVEAIDRSDKYYSYSSIRAPSAAYWEADYMNPFIGWRYADEKPSPKMVPLGPDDVLPGSVFRAKIEQPIIAWWAPRLVDKDGFTINQTHWKWTDKEMKGFEINRSIPLTGKWDANAWEPCEKEEAK
jgi:hypothetical protein